MQKVQPTAGVSVGPLLTLSNKILMSIPTYLDFGLLFFLLFERPQNMLID
jgi:hypothetical protein